MPARCLVRTSRGLALWSNGRLRLAGTNLDELMGGGDIREGEEIDPAGVTLLAPVESQEVWGCGVTYMRSRAARMEESATADIYAKAYEAERPEIFFKSAGWRVVGHDGEIGIRPDSTWDVPEPELAVLSNSRGEVVAYAVGNDMSSRSIEGENPLYLPQAKVYDRSCSIGPAAVLATEVDPTHAAVRMTIERDGWQIFSGESNVAGMVRDPAKLTRVLHSAYPLPLGAWLLTGTSLVPAPPFTSRAGDVVTMEIDGVGRLVNRVVVIPHSGASARPRL
jgi:2-dehydro-3-deoxy-D-arabinonate dehydratase